MNSVKLRSTTPRRIDPSVRRLLQTMQLNPSHAVWLEFHRPKDFKPEFAECHINVLIQCRLHKGEPVSGWTIWQDRAQDFVEAQFHTVWRAQDKRILDLTPRQDREHSVLFVPDPSHRFGLTQVDGQPAVRVYDSVRMQSGVLLNQPDERFHVCVTDLIYEHGIAHRS